MLKKLQETQLMVDTLGRALQNLQNNINDTSKKLYDTQEQLLHLKEILRLAKHQFARLRGQPNGSLTEADYAELLKWISRTKNSDGLKDIIAALTELSKYYPKDIKTNLYGLVQKIIIEGPYKKTKK